MRSEQNVGMILAAVALSFCAIALLITKILSPSKLMKLSRRPTHMQGEEASSVKGLSQAVIDKYTVQATYPLRNEPQERLEGHESRVVTMDTCSICLEEFSSRDRVRLLPCGHLFHGAKCIDEWLANKSPQCPLCKVSIIVVS